MDFPNTISELTNHFLLHFQAIKLKSAIGDAITNCLHLPDNSNVQIEGTLTFDVNGVITPITLTFGDSDNSETSSQLSRTPSKRKAYIPVKYTGQQSPPCSHQLPNEEPISHSESIPPTSIKDCPLDLTKGASVPSSLQETPVKHGSVLVNEVMKVFQQNLFLSPSLPLNHSASTLPTMVTPIQFESHSAAPSPKRRRRVGETSIRKSCELRQFRCNQCDGLFNSLRDLECHTLAVHCGFRCHLCKKPFTQRSNLQRHALKHVDFKPFECVLCEKAYYRKDHLTRHMQKTHPFHPVGEGIRVKLRSSESLDYLRRINEDYDATNTAVHQEKTNSESFKMENIKAPESGELTTMETDTNATESPPKTSPDFLSDESNPPNVDEFALPGSPH
nr:zinc finger protein [Hymenolepis microstoma]